MLIQELIEKAHETAREKGWWEEGKVKSPVECHALVITELSEAIEELRKGTPHVYFEKPTEETKQVLFQELKANTVGLAKAGFKPEGEAIEIADAVIRLADYCGFHKIDLVAAIQAKLAYNDTRSYRHGNKKY